MSYGIGTPRETDRGWQLRWRDPRTGRVRRRTLASRDDADQLARDLTETRQREAAQLQERISDLRTMLTNSLPASLDPVDAVGIAIDDPTSRLGLEVRELHQRRRSIIDASPID